MDDDLTPLGRLLEGAREARRPKLSQNAVAKAADTSPTTYRRVIKGIARLGGRDVPFDGAPESIARIAKVLDVSPAQLEEAGRADVAEELRALSSRTATERFLARPVPTDEELRASALKPETAEAIIAMRQRFERWAREGKETQILRANRLTEVLDEESDAG